MVAMVKINAIKDILKINNQAVNAIFNKKSFLAIKNIYNEQYKIKGK